MLGFLPWETKETVMSFTANGKGGAIWGGGIFGHVILRVQRQQAEVLRVAGAPCLQNESQAPEASKYRFELKL